MEGWNVFLFICYWGIRDENYSPSVSYYDITILYPERGTNHIELPPAFSFCKFTV